MDNFDPQKKPFYLLKELKNLPKPPQKETLSFLNLQKKNNTKKTQKQNLPQTTKVQTGNVIKETIIFNVPNTGKNRTLEKVPNTKNTQNKTIYKNNLDFNPNKKKASIKNKEKNKSPEKPIKNNELGNDDYKKYNSVCVSINNNYNYNLSLGNTNTISHDKFKEKGESWQDKMQRINKQKDNINYLDYKKLTESEFFKNKFAQKEKEKEEKEYKLNKSENDYNFKQKIKEMNSAPPPKFYNINYRNEKKNDINEDIKDNLNINNELKNNPKKKTGILGFLQAFKDFLEPINIRKKNSITNIKDNFDKNNSNINNINNKINVNLKINENKIINIPTTPKINNSNNNNNYNNNQHINNINLSENNINNKYINNSVNTTPKILLYERKNNLYKNNDQNNYYSDDAYDSCPITNNTTYKYTHKNMNMNKYNENKNEKQIFSYSQKNIFKNNDINGGYQIKERNDFGGYTDKRNYYNKEKEKEQKEIGLYNTYGFSKNEKDNYNNTYMKRPNNMRSPIINKEYNREIRNFSFNDINQRPNNNIFANYLNDLNAQKEIINKPVIKKKLLDKFDEDYNDEENINENLNINAEKKIQEIKINIKHKNNKNDYFDINRTNNKHHKVNNSAIYTNKKVYSTIDDLIMNPKPQNKIETCIINFNKSKSSNQIYNTPKVTYKKNKFEDNFNTNISNYSESNYNTSNNNEIYKKPKYDLSLSQRNISQKMNIDSDSDNQSTNSYKTTNPMRKKNYINKSERIFNVNKGNNNNINNNNQESGDTDSESNSEISEISQISTKSVKQNTIYFKPFKSFFNKNKKGDSLTSKFLNKIFRRDKKYDTDDDSFNSEKSNISNNSFINIANIKPKVSNRNLHLFKKIYNYNITLPKNITKGYYVTRRFLKIMKLPKKKLSLYTKDFFKIIQKPKLKINYIDKKRIRIKKGLNLPILKNNSYFTKKDIIIQKEQYIENLEINIENNDSNENININEEITIKNKNYFSPNSSKNKDNNSLTYSPQFGTKRENPALNPSRSARDINKIVSIEIDLSDNENNTPKNTINKDLNSTFSNIKVNQGDGLYVKKKPNMKKINENVKCKTYVKNNQKVFDNLNTKKINAFNIEPENIKIKSNIKNNQIININLKNNINKTKINNNNDDINSKIIKTLNESNNIQIIVEKLFLIITQKNQDISKNGIRLPYMQILSNENIFAEIIIKKSMEENNQKIIFNNALICQQLCFKLNNNLILNNVNQVDEDLKTILTEESKLQFENILNNNHNINDNELLRIIIFIAELIKLKIIPINQGFYTFEKLYKKFKTANRNKYLYLDVIIILLNKIGKNLLKEKIFIDVNNFVDKELVNLINFDSNLPLFLKNKIIELTNIKKFQWMIDN